MNSLPPSTSFLSSGNLPSFGGLVPWDNQFFSGGLGIAGLGFMAQLMRRGSTVGSMLLRRHFLVTLEITSKDSSYPWVLNWLNAQGRRTQHLSVQTAFKKQVDGSTSLHFDLVPGPGRHWVKYSNRYFLVERTRETNSINMQNGQPWEKVVLTSIGRNVLVFQSLLEEAQRNAMQTEEGFTTIFTCWGTEWRPFGLPRRKRPLESVVLAQGQSTRILNDLLEWKQSAQWYQQRGIPYRRGYLLHGPPGSGKTSFIFALAGHLNYNIAILNLNDEGMNDDRLAHAMSMVPPRSFILLEDIDAAFVHREQAGGNHLTFSGLLNTLDGVASTEERIVWMTTNHLERLDKALIRPGRVDVVECLDNASLEQVEQLFVKFFPEANQSVTQLFLNNVTRLGWNPSMAVLQGFLLQYKNHAQEAAENVYQVLDKQKPTATNVKDSSEATSVVVPSTNRPPRRRLTAFDVDRMVFNPQPGWDQGL